MKKLLYVLLLSLFVFTSCEQEEEIIDVTAEKQLPKVDVCHYDADTDTWKTLSINENALKAHLDHGDFEGSCEDRRTYIPDEVFEWSLIKQGYDDVLDHYVLTSNIINITSLSIPEVAWDLPGVFHEVFNTSLVGIEDFRALKYLTVGGYIAELDLSNNLNLETLRVGDKSYIGFYGRGNLKMLDISTCIALTEIKILGGSFAGLDLSNNKKLTYLFLRSRELTSLDLSNNIELSYYFMEDTKITNLDFSNNIALTHVTIIDYYSTLSKLNIKNGNNILITGLDSYGRTNFNVGSESLTCLQVDDVAWSIANWGFRDTYSVDCY